MTKTIARCLALSALFLAAACGSDTLPNGGGDGGTDMAMQLSGDMAQNMSGGGDMAYALRDDGGAFTCGGSAACSGGTAACCAGVSDGGALQFSCQASCTGNTVPFQCNAPEQCGGFPCCAQLDGNGLGAVQCETALTACVPKLDLAKQAITTRFCKLDADCTAGVTTQLNQCCTLTVGANPPQHLCLNTGLAGLVNQQLGSGGMVTCP